MFFGEYQHSIDENGRLAVPAKFRPQLKVGAVVTRGLDQCLFLYPAKEWQKLAERLSKLPINQANARAFARNMLAGAMDGKPDGQGRVMVPEYLRDYAGIKKKVIVAGLYNRLEIWDNERWQTYKRASEKESNDIAEKLGEFGF